MKLTKKETEMNAEDWRKKYINLVEQVEIIREKIELLYKLTFK